MIELKITYNIKEGSGLEVIRFLMIPVEVINNYYINLKLMRYLKS